MASGSLIYNPGLDEMARHNPGVARFEQRIYPDPVTGLPTTKRGFIVFPKVEVINPELICEFMLPQGYAGTTGLTATFAYAVEWPVVTGAVVFDVAFERMKASNAGSSINQSGFFLPSKIAANTVATTPGSVKNLSQAVAKANTLALIGQTTLAAAALVGATSLVVASSLAGVATNNLLLERDASLQELAIASAISGQTAPATYTVGATSNAHAAGSRVDIFDATANIAAAGDMMRMRIRRLTADAGDTCAVAALLLSLSISET